jgi:hypothetical protein
VEVDLGKAGSGRSPAPEGKLRGGRRPGAAVLVPLLAACALAIGAAEAAMYKWVDEKGVTHYTDTMPPDAVNKANTQLNQQGIPVRKTDPAITPEQRKAREAEAERQREAAKLQEETARRDRALLDSYTTESDIDLAKNRSLRTVENALKSAQAYSAQLTKRRTELNANKAALAGKPVPAALERDLASTEAELGRQADFIALKEKELVTIAARYDADKARWAAIKGGSVPPPAPAAPAAASAGAGKK